MGVPNTVGVLTVFIRYQLDPFKLPLFEKYAQAWLEIIPRCGGDVFGYFMPHEGTNYEAFGIVRFPSLAEYESYRVRLKSDEAGSANFAFAMKERFVLQESRTFLQKVRA